MKTEFLNKETINEGLGEDAARAEQDHEVQMARADCFYAAKDAIELHRILSGISEAEGIEGWVAGKITLAADYLRVVKEHLEYKSMEHAQVAEQEPEIEFIDEVSWINGKKQDDKELVWKQTSMSYEEACKKYGKENCRLGGKNRRGDDTVEVKVPLAEDATATSAGNVASAMAGNGFANGGPGTLKRFKKKEVSEALPSVGSAYNMGTQNKTTAAGGDVDDDEEVVNALKKAGNSQLANKVKTGTTFNKDEMKAIIAAKG